jgi:hypothetical protein
MMWLISSSVILSDAFDLHLSDLVDRQPVCRTSDRSDEGYLWWVMLRLGAVIVKRPGDASKKKNTVPLTLTLELNFKSQ